jgi:UDP-glucose 4-epimerase
MRCLLIGGAGFLGQSITHVLSKKGVDEILVLDLPDREGAVSTIPNVDFIAGNYLDLEKNDAVFADVDSVVYLATDSHPQASMVDIERDALNNINPAIRMMESCRFHGVSNIVFASSGGTIYGDSEGVPLTEAHPKAPICAYGVVKLAIENYLQLYSSQFGLRTYSLRISNAYGPGQLQGAVIGSIANFLKKIVRGEPLEVWGDGNIVRDYIYIADIVDGFARCILNSASIQPGDYNIGSGKGYSLNQVIDIICEVTGLSVEVSYSAGRDFDVQSIVLDSSKMTQASNWFARTELREGIREMFKSFSILEYLDSTTKCNS